MNLTMKLDIQRNFAKTAELHPLLAGEAGLICTTPWRGAGVCQAQATLNLIPMASGRAPSRNPAAGDPPSRQPPYTTFTLRQRHFLTFLLGFTTITSPLTATIYFPLLPLLAQRLDISAQSINLTITIYIIFQAVSPAIFGALSDAIGRRIAYLVTLTVYVLSNLGLALAQNSYVALIILRALQSLGASAAFAISYGVVADVCVPAARGSMIGPISMALNLGTCVGPIVGGWVAYKSHSVDWVFWFLLIVGALLLLSIALFLPETARNVVGNGDIKVTRWWESSTAAPIWRLVAGSLGKRQRSDNEENTIVAELGEKRRGVGENRCIETKKTFNILDPLRSVRLIFLKDASQILLLHGLNYMIDYSVQTAIPAAYKDIYRFNELQIGLSYLPRGVGIIFGGYTNGKLMDWNYKITARQIGHEIDHVHGDDISNFPIERARTRGSQLLLSTMALSVIGYGWALHYSAHVSVPLIIQFFQGFLGTSIYTFSSTLLVDVLSETPSTASAASSIIRCALAAMGTATVQPLIDVMGRGWYFTLLGMVVGSASILAVSSIRRWGMRWRIQRVSKNTASSGIVNASPKNG